MTIAKKAASLIKSTGHHVDPDPVTLDRNDRAYPVTPPAPTCPKFKSKRAVEVYLRKGGQFGWRIWAKNGQVLGNNAEGHKRKAHALEMAKAIAMGNDWAVIDSTSGIFIHVTGL